MRPIISSVLFLFFVLQSFAQSEAVIRHNKLLELSSGGGQVKYTIPEEYTIECPSEKNWSKLKLHPYGHSSLIKRCFYIAPDSILAFNLQLTLSGFKTFESSDSIMRIELDSLIKYAVNGEAHLLDPETLIRHNATNGFCIEFDVNPDFYAKDIYDRVVFYYITNYKSGHLRISFMLNKKNLADPIIKKKIDEEMKRILSGFSFKNRRS